MDYTAAETQAREALTQRVSIEGLTVKNIKGSGLGMTGDGRVNATPREILDKIALKDRGDLLEQNPRFQQIMHSAANSICAGEKPMDAVLNSISNHTGLDVHR